MNSGSRAAEKLNGPEDWAVLAERGRLHVDALGYIITIARAHEDLHPLLPSERDALRDVLAAEWESALYHQARADGIEHEAALDTSREGRKLAANLI